MKYLSVAEMIKIEKAADARGHSYSAMMEAAGRGLAVVIHEEYALLAGKRITALVGSGNNGGDALVALDYLISWGWNGSVLLYRQREDEDELINRVLARHGRVLDCIDFPLGIEIINEEIITAKVVMDGVLGTGIKLPLRKPLGQLLSHTKTLISELNPRPEVVAVDCPSGMDCDSGGIDPACLPADMTVTMAAVKQGLLRYPAYDFVGKLKMVGIGLPEDLPEIVNISREIVTREWVKQVLPERPSNAHKGDFGTALIIAGSVNYPGAAILAGQSAYKIGAGLVTMAVPEIIYSEAISKLLEATWVILNDQDGGISSSSIPKVKDAIIRSTACLFGPGLGNKESTRKFLEKLFEIKELPPLVIDADGLRLLSHLEDWQDLIPSRSVLTPHPGEMAILTGLSVEDIQSDRVYIAEKYAKEWEQILVLKGAHTVISEPGGKTMILISANSALSKAGSGDVLAGIITGLTAQGMPPFRAAASGSWIHAMAGSAALVKIGNPAAVLAGDISESIAEVIPD